MQTPPRKPLSPSRGDANVNKLFNQTFVIYMPLQHRLVAPGWRVSRTLVGTYTFTRAGHEYLDLSWVLSTYEFCCICTLVIASPNDNHNSEKLHDRFWSGSAILMVAPLSVSCKNPHPQSKFQPIALQCTSNWSVFILLFKSTGKNNHLTYSTCCLVF